MIKHFGYNTLDYFKFEILKLCEEQIITLHMKYFVL